MKLKTVHKEKKVESSQTKKKRQSKSDKANKLSSNFNSLTPFKYKSGRIEVGKLTYGIIDSCELKSVETMDGLIELDGSWTEFILIMLDALISRKPDSFNHELTENKITNQWFMVDKYYGKYDFDHEQAKVYRIYNSGYYLEAVFNDENIFFAVVGLLKSLGYSYNEVSFNIKNIAMSMNDNTEDETEKPVDLNIVVLDEEYETANLSNVLRKLKPGILMVGMELNGVRMKVHRIDVALKLFCEWVASVYNANPLLHTNAVGRTGVCISEDLYFADEADFREDTGSNETGDSQGKVYFEQLVSGMLYVYTDLNQKDIVEYMRNVAKAIELKKDDCIFIFKYLKQSKRLKEWEVE